MTKLAKRMTAGMLFVASLASTYGVSYVASLFPDNWLELWWGPPTAVVGYMWLVSVVCALGFAGAMVTDSIQETK